jgi:hypothetical protein
MWRKAYEDRRYVILRYKAGDTRLEVLYDRKTNKYTGAWIDLGNIDHPWFHFKKPTRYLSIAKERALTLIDDRYYALTYIYQ